MVSLGLNGQPDQTVTPRRLLMGHHGKCRGRNRKCGQLGACALMPLNRKNCERAYMCNIQCTSARTLQFDSLVPQCCATFIQYYPRPKILCCTHLLLFCFTELDNLTLVCMGRSLFSLSPTWFAHSGICAIVQASSYASLDFSHPQPNLHFHMSNLTYTAHQVKVAAWH